MEIFLYHEFNITIIFIIYIVGLGVSALRDDPDYIRYYMNWTRFIVTALIPITGQSQQLHIIIQINLLCILNPILYMIQYRNLILFEIALVYFNTNIFRGIQMSHERTRRKNTQRASEMNLAAILFCIVVVFIICHFPRILLNVHELIMLDDMMECGESGNYRLLI